MTPAASPSPSDAGIPQIWLTLPLELKQRAIQCLAQLAFNLAVAQTNWFAPDADHAHDAQPSQNPS